MRAALIAMLLFGVASFAAPSPARADATVTEESVQNGFPRNIVFNVAATADAEITDVTLNYRIAGRSTSARGKPDFVAASTSIDTSVTVTTSASSYIPVGSEFLYSWEFEFADGTTSNSPEQSFLYLPPGPEWQDVENEIVRVYYHGDRQATAEEYLQAGLETYGEVARDLFGIDLTLLPVKVVLFAEEPDLEEARPGAGGTLDAAVINCGTKVTSDIVFVIHRSCGTSDRTDTFRHELGHIINEAAGEGPLGILPSWLDEGTAVLAQSEPGQNYASAVDAALRSGRLIPFDQMATASSNASQVNLFYGQSYAMVLFLIEQGGPETFSEFFATIKAGNRFDDALEQVYGFDLTGFEEAFYAANGVQSQPPVANPTSPGSQSGGTPVPTRPPLQTTSSGSSNDDDLDTVVIGVVGASMLFGLVAVFFYLLSLMLANNRKASANAAPSESDDEDWRPPPPPKP